MNFSFYNSLKVCVSTCFSLQVFMLYESICLFMSQFLKIGSVIYLRLVITVTYTDELATAIAKVLDSVSNKRMSVF